MCVCFEIKKDLQAVGGVPVAAAGNSGMDACAFAPAFSDKAVTVGAYDYQYGV